MGGEKKEKYWKGKKGESNVNGEVDKGNKTMRKMQEDKQYKEERKEHRGGGGQWWRQVRHVGNRRQWEEGE